MQVAPKAHRLCRRPLRRHLGRSNTALGRSNRMLTTRPATRQATAPRKFPPRTSSRSSTTCKTAAPARLSSPPHRKIPPTTRKGKSSLGDRSCRTTILVSMPPIRQTRRFNFGSLRSVALLRPAQFLGFGDPFSRSPDAQPHPRSHLRSVSRPTPHPARPRSPHPLY